MHFVRRQDYRGKLTDIVSDARFVLPFDAMTTAGLFFAAPCFKETRFRLYPHRAPPVTNLLN